MNALVLLCSSADYQLAICLLKTLKVKPYVLVSVCVCPQRSQLVMSCSLRRAAVYNTTQHRCPMAVRWLCRWVSDRQVFGVSDMSLSEGSVK